MKIKETKTFIFEDRITLDIICDDIKEKTGMNLVLNEPGEIVHGYINSYYKTIDNKEYTLVDIFLYEGDKIIEINSDKHQINHEIKEFKEENKLFNGKEKLKFEIPDNDIQLKLLKGLGKIDKK